MIGVGMGRNMLRIHDDAESTLVVRAICDLSLDAVRRVASEHNREALFETGDYREILDRFDTDVVGIYSLDHLRMQHLRDALESGKQFIGTKPMVISLKEAKATVDPVRKTEKITGRADVPVRAEVHGGKNSLGRRRSGTFAVCRIALRARYANAFRPDAVALRGAPGLHLRRCMSPGGAPTVDRR